MMYRATKLAALLLASWLAAAPPASGARSSPDGGETMFGHPLEEVPPALRTLFIVRARDLPTLSAFGRQGDVVAQLQPLASVQSAVGYDYELRPAYFAYEAEKRRQLTLVVRAMMEDTEFLECMAPCLNLPLPVLLQMPTRSSPWALYFCGVKCQLRTGQERGIVFPYIELWLDGWRDSPKWHDLTQDHAPFPFVAEQAARQLPVFVGKSGPAAVRLSAHAALPHPHPHPHPGARPSVARTWARWRRSWPAWERAVQKKLVPALEREIVAGGE
ncbi:MAG: hypothetical protein M1826_006419 [Phylliscum demangeonii]|nr:MAG: hypothetical protein M1826_006419 [Phylliscum demangeonii]